MLLPCCDFIQAWSFHATLKQTIHCHLVVTEHMDNYKNSKQQKVHDEGQNSTNAVLAVIFDTTICLLNCGHNSKGLCASACLLLTK